MNGRQLPLLEPDPALRNLWIAEAARGPHFAPCDRCRRSRADDGGPLLVARRERSRQFLCLECFADTRGRRRKGERS